MIEETCSIPKKSPKSVARKQPKTSIVQKAVGWMMSAVKKRRREDAKGMGRYYIRSGTRKREWNAVPNMEGSTETNGGANHLFL